MTAAPIEWPSLDKILADATPVEPVPFDLDEYVVLPGTREQIARHINSLRVDIETARSLSCSLEAELAQQTARVTEALGFLGDALLWCNDGYSNTADSISEAIAALRGEGE